MNEAPKSWLLPSALVGYVALSAGYGQAIYGGLSRKLPTLLLVGIVVSPFLTAFALRRTSQLSRTGGLSTDERAVRHCIMGGGLLLASSSADDAQPALLAAHALAQGLLVAGAAMGIARLRSAPSILKTHPAALSLDGYYLVSLLWSLLTCVYLMRATFPGQFPLDPVSLQLGSLFASLGSLLVLGALVLRLQLLRGLQLGVGDRAWAALSLCVSGVVLGASAGLIVLAPPDRIAGWVVAVVSAGVLTTMAAPVATRVTRVVRGLLAGLILSAPSGLFLLWLAGQNVAKEVLVAASGFVGIAIGIATRRAARPLSPEGSRWETALSRAIDAALHPEPEQGMREALICLRAAEASSKRRPELFRIDPPAMISVDIAGYVHVQKADFPKGIVELAADEPARTLRRETLEAAQVRTPQVRPLANWFEAHEAKTATVLLEEANPIGLLILPRGKRRTPLTVEEAELLHKLSQRMAGLLSVTAALKRARLRELDYQRAAEQALTTANDLTLRLNQKTRTDHLEAEARVEILRDTANSPAAQVALLELEARANDRVLRLGAQVGIDPVPWAAHVHLTRFDEARPLVVIDFRSSTQKNLSQEDLAGEASPLRRALTGTLVLLHPQALSETKQEQLAASLESLRPEFIVVGGPPEKLQSPRLAHLLDGQFVSLPSLADRAEDIQALIIHELARLGLVKNGEPLGIERAALFELIERPYPGNDDELRGLLTALSGQSSSPRVTLADLHAILGNGPRTEEGAEEAGREPPPPRRSRSRRPPRAKRL